VTNRQTDRQTDRHRAAFGYPGNLLPGYIFTTRVPENKYSVIVNFIDSKRTMVGWDN